MNILYVHGLSSSGNSHTVASLRRLLPNDRIVSPDLPLDPLEALNLLKTTVVDASIDLVIGTSMGGMFAQKLHGSSKILVNPAFHVSQFMRDRIGVHDFLNPRKDGVQQFVITEELCDCYAALESNQFASLPLTEDESTFGLFGDEDDLINCKPDFIQYYTHWQSFHGGHRLNEEIIKTVLLPLIEQFRG